MRPQDVAVHFLHKFLYVFIIHCSEIKVMLHMYIFPYLDNTWVIRMFINNSGKAISRLKIVWDIIFKTDIHGHMREKIIKNITDFPFIGYNFIIFFKYDIITRGLFKGEKRLDGFPGLLIFCTSITTFTKIGSLGFLLNGCRDIPLHSAYIPFH